MSILAWFCAAALLVQPASYEAGVEARHAGRFEDSARILYDVAERQPANADVFLQLGLALMALGRFDEAQAALERALALAPDYPDVRLALARLAYFRGELERAADLADQVERNGEAQALREAIARARETPTPRHWRADVFASYSTLTEGLSAWREAGAALGRRVSENATLTGTAQWHRRFDEDDVYLSLTYGRSLRHTGSASVEIGGAPDGTFRAQRAVRADYASPTAPNGEGLQATFEAMAAEYEAGGVLTVRPGVRYLADRDRLRLELQGVAFLDENGEYRAGWAVAGEFQASDRKRVLLRYVDAPETSSGRTSEVRALALGLRYQLSARVGLYTALVHEQRENFDRTELTIAANHRF